AGNGRQPQAGHQQPAELPVRRRAVSPHCRVPPRRGTGAWLAGGAVRRPSRGAGAPAPRTEGVPDGGRHVLRPPTRGAAVSVFRILITGSRDWSDEDTVWGALDIVAREVLSAGCTEIVVVHGAAKGPDMLADAWVRSRRQYWPVR